MSEEISREEIAALLARGSEEMTREEAIVVLQGYLDNPLINNKEPFNMAISALSEQRTGHWSREAIESMNRWNDYVNGKDVEPMTIAEPCSDAISRQALLKKSWDAETRCGYVQVVDVGDIMDAPSVQPISIWIPVSERLPERNGQYLVTKSKGDYTYIGCMDYSTNLAKTDKFDFHGKNYAGWYEYDMEYGFLETGGVIAWMPLPKPYDPQESEEV